MEFWLGIDIGSTTTEVAVSEIANPANPAESVDYLLKFPSSEPTQVKKSTDELDTTIVFTKDSKKFSFGSDGLSIANRLVFKDWKLGAMGEKRHAENLIETCRLVQQCLGHQKFTPASLFRMLFEYILKTATEHFRTQYGESFGPIKAWLTYPSCGESIRVLLLQEAIAAGIDVRGAASESLSAACFVEGKTNLSLPDGARLILPDGARLILDFGGATVVECHCSPPTANHRLIIHRMLRSFTKMMMASWFRLVLPRVCFAFRYLGEIC